MFILGLGIIVWDNHVKSSSDPHFVLTFPAVRHFDHPSHRSWRGCWDEVGRALGIERDILAITWTRHGFLREMIYTWWVSTSM